MRLTTIWTLRGMALTERLARSHEWMWRTLAHQLPRELAYWSYLDTGARTIAGDEIVPDVRYLDLLDRIQR